MLQKSKHTLIHSKSGHLAFKLYALNNLDPFDHIQRLNYYTIVWVKSGKGKITSDFFEYSFEKNYLLSFNLYQAFMLQATETVEVEVLHFHPDFFCIYKHHKEVSCDGVLFNNIYDPPMVKLEDKDSAQIELLFNQMKEGLEQDGLAQSELLVSYLKILLITASRVKIKDHHLEDDLKSEFQEPFILQNLKDCIEEHYRTKKAVAEYADLLAITPKALARITKKYLNKTMSELIGERIVIEAKRELYLTNKTVKEIAYDLGYSDEYYFSRFFKKNANVSPQLFRETVGYAKAVS